MQTILNNKYSMKNYYSKKKLVANKYDIHESHESEQIVLKNGSSIEAGISDDEVDGPTS